MNLRKSSMNAVLNAPRFRRHSPQRLKKPLTDTADDDLLILRRSQNTCP